VDWAPSAPQLCHAGYRPYHIHLTFGDYGIPQDEASAKVVAAGVIAAVEADGFKLWPNSCIIDYDGERIVATVLVLYQRRPVIEVKDLPRISSATAW
jgi:hypothetical protein